MRDAGELLEWAEVHGNLYGTPRAPVEEILSDGRDALFDIDYQGTQQVREKMGADTVTVFILPPSMKELRARLERRAEDPRDVIERRLENARNEIRRWNEYDYVLSTTICSAPSMICWRYCAPSVSVGRDARRASRNL